MCVKGHKDFLFKSAFFGIKVITRCYNRLLNFYFLLLEIAIALIINFFFFFLKQLEVKK